MLCSFGVSWSRRILSLSLRRITFNHLSLSKVFNMVFWLQASSMLYYSYSAFVNIIESLAHSIIFIEQVKEMMKHIICVIGHWCNMQCSNSNRRSTTIYICQYKIKCKAKAVQYWIRDITSSLLFIRGWLGFEEIIYITYLFNLVVRLDCVLSQLSFKVNCPENEKTKLWYLVYWVPRTIILYTLPS